MNKYLLLLVPRGIFVSSRDRIINMARFSLVIILLSFLFVRSDGQCSCSDLEFVKQLLQQEIFERKLEISKLRSEIRTSSHGHELIETDSFKDLGADTITKRVDTLEQRVIELENASSDGRKSETDENDAKLIHTQDEKDFQSIVRNTLKDEKIERVNFVANVQNQIERVNENISLFMNTTDAFLDEQVKKLSANYENFEYNSSKALSEFRKSVEDLSQEHATEMEGSMNLIQKSMTELERNVSTKFEDFTIKTTKTMDDKILKTETEMKGINDDMTNLTRNIEELQRQFETHLRRSEMLFDKVAKAIGTCDIYGEQWKLNDKKCYRVIDGQEISWINAKTECENIKGELLIINSKEENDFITKSFTGGKWAFWIGLHDTNTENVWQWSSTEGNLNPLRFTNWLPNEPNDANGNEDCDAIYNNGHWNDYPCSRMLPFICEADPQL